MASQPPAEISRATTSETAIPSTQIAQATTEPSAPNTISTSPPISAHPPHANPTTPTTSLPPTQTTHSPPAPQPNPLSSPYPPHESITHARKASNPPIIPPPPKAGQLPPASTLQTTPTTLPHTPTTPSQTNPSPYHPQPQLQPQPPTQLPQPLDHPPGYIQNPAANAPLGAFHNHLYPDDVTGRGGYHLYPAGRDLNASASGVATGVSASGGGTYYPSPSTTRWQADGYPQPAAAAGVTGGRWRWDEAPGGAGGRYEYVYDRGRLGEDDGDGEGDWWGAEGIWNATVEFARGVGEGVARAEEGVWRWINGR
ncbi:hypothetical protein FQN51_005484 [Onygenales sp. PD_10]|nr:hypothetical protein FQN51_005484 [Onygenales sp. PD_10]